MLKNLMMPFLTNIKEIFNKFKIIYLFILSSIFVNLTILYLIFLVYRTIGQRIPLNPLWLTGIFIFFFIIRRSLFIVMIKIYDFYQFIRPKSKEKEEENKLKNKIEIFVEKIYDFFFYNVLQDFFYRFYPFNLISLSFFKFFDFFLNRFKIFGFFFVILPWFLFLFYFFKEIMFSDNLQVSLSCLSLNFLIRRLLFFGLIFCQFEYTLLKKKVFSNNFKIFYGEEITENFFIFNPIIRHHFFFEEPFLKNKRTIKRLWRIFVEIFFFSKAKQLLEIFKTDFARLLKLTTEINFIIFVVAFILIFLNKFLILFPLFITLLVFFACFFIFCLLLNFLKENIPEQDSNIFLLNTNTLLNFHLDKNFLLTKKQLLITYSFLKSRDLPFPYTIKKTVIQLDIEKDDVFIDSFSKDEREFIDLVTEEIYLTWFMPNVLNGKINLDTLSFKEK